MFLGELGEVIQPEQLVNIWGKNWKFNNWKTSNGKDVKNLDLIKNLHNLVKSKNVKFYHIRSHQKEPNDTIFWVQNV